MQFPPELKAQLPCQCTRHFTGDTPTVQRFCYCLTCGITPETNRCLCEACAYACHADHKFCYGGTGPAVCSCGLKFEAPSGKKKGRKVQFNSENQQPNVCVCFDHPVEMVAFDFEQEEEEEEADDNNNEKPPIEMTPCLEVDNLPYACTLSSTDECFYLQHNYRCLTCKQKVGEAVCAVCARVCHAGHQLQDNGITPFYCDCGLGSIKKLKCKCLYRNDKKKSYSIADNDLVVCLPFEIPMKCTAEFEKKKDGSCRPFIQRCFACQTCGISEDSPICEVCALNCHQGHKLEDLGLREMTCNCKPETCQCRKDTDKKFVPSLCTEEGISSYNCGCISSDDDCAENPDDDNECHHCHNEKCGCGGHHHHHDDDDDNDN